MILGVTTLPDKCQSFVVRGLGKQDQIMISGSDKHIFNRKCESEGNC